jgi:hypothetical protein
MAPVFRSSRLLAEFTQGASYSRAAVRRQPPPADCAAYFTGRPGDSGTHRRCAESFCATAADYIESLCIARSFTGTLQSIKKKYSHTV